jgi:hypothetical protein
MDPRFFEGTAVAAHARAVLAAEATVAADAANAADAAAGPRGD